MNTPNDIEFNHLTGDVRVHGVNYRFRPKTFELLQLLASSPAQVFSKTEILQQIWPEAIVEEQAIFQSINEIRKAFAPVDVIKTYPKKGYAWVLPAPSLKPRNAGSGSKRFQTLTLVGLLLCLLVGIVAIVGIAGRSSWQQPAQHQQTSTEAGANTAAAHSAVLVLPFDVSQLDSSQHWLKFAGMAALIQQLQPSREQTVFQLTDVMDILKRLPAAMTTDHNGNMSLAAIARLFQVAGVTQIVQVKISGVPGDYQLIYTLHHANSQQKSAVHSTSFDQSLPQLAQQVSARFSQQTNAQTDIQQQLLATTIELVAKQQFAQALPLATSAATLAANEVFAHYVLAGIQLQLGEFAQAFVTTEHALTMQQASDYSQYVARLWYQKGVLLLQRGDFTAAEPTLQQASVLANQQKDWLYLAYSHAMLAQLKLAQQQYTAALPLLTAALQYQQILQCPIGIAQSELDLAGYLMLTDQPEHAKQKYQTSKALVQQKNLTQLHPVLLEFEKRWLKQLAEVAPKKPDLSL